MLTMVAALLGLVVGFFAGWYWSDKTVRLALKISTDFARARGDEPPTATLVAEPEDPEPETQEKPKDGELSIQFEEGDAC